MKIPISHRDESETEGGAAEVDAGVAGKDGDKLSVDKDREIVALFRRFEKDAAGRIDDEGPIREGMRRSG